MNPIAEARDLFKTEWAEKLNRKFQNNRLHHCCYFGGGGGSDVETFDPYRGTGVRELYKKLGGWLGPQIGQGITPYQGQLTPGVSPLQQQGFGGAAGLTPLATGAMGYGQQALGMADPQAAQRMMGMAETGLGGLMGAFDPSMALQALEPAKQFGLQTFKEDIVPMIMEKYGPAMGAKDAGAIWRGMGKEGANLASQLSAQASQYIYPAWQSHLGRQQQGVGQAMQMAGMPGEIAGQAGRLGGMGADLLGQAVNMGGVQRGISGEQLQEPYQKWQQAQPYNNPYLQNFLGTALQQPGMQAVTQQQGPGAMAQMMPALGMGLGGYFAGGGTLGGMLGGLGGLFGGGAAAGASIPPALAAAPWLLACDVRLKENFARIENALEKVNRLEGHTYNFVNEDNRSAGIIAQELEKVLPEAVLEHEDLKYIRVDGVIALLVNAIKELDEKVSYAIFEAKRAF